MSRSLRIALAFCLAALPPALAGCDSETASSQLSTDGGGGSDDRFHPPPNGVKVAEATACAALHAALQDNALALGCTSTIRPCPDLVRSEFGAECLQYDDGTVQACVAFYDATTSCDDFGSPLACAVVAYTQSAPAGCP
ncbi:MAG: hypothetical protein IT373_03085 [Polyangiaceae bacterium]|nr:hypothetical protein [Polyangiaceae bacterium]